MPHDLTWVMLLGHWTALAKSALALPRDARGDRWRGAIAPIITLQALCQALGELDDLDDDERALGLDKSELLIQSNTTQLHELWRGEPLPELVIELIDDARSAHTTARLGGVEWTLHDDSAILDHPARLMAALEDLGFAGDLFLPTPGVPVFASAPVGYARGPHGGPPDEKAIALVTAFWRACSVGVDGPTPAPQFRQVYRQFDFARGGPVRDLVADSDATLPAGQPLLVPIMLQGVSQPVALLPRPSDLPGPLPVVFDGAQHHDSPPDAAL